MTSAHRNVGRIEATCEGCGMRFEYTRTFGRVRKWCSERCRRRALYAGTCERCGALTDGSGGPNKAPRFCIACTGCIPARLNRDRAEAEAHRFLALRRAGHTNCEIAEITGRPAVSVARSLARLRANGIDVGRSPYDIDRANFKGAQRVAP